MELTRLIIMHLCVKGWLACSFHMFIIYLFKVTGGFMPTLIIPLCVEKSVVGMGVSYCNHCGL
jgi:hypothetical protein